MSRTPGLVVVAVLGVGALVGVGFAPAAQAASSPAPAGSILTIEGTPNSSLQAAGTAYVSSSVTPHETPSNPESGETFQLDTTSGTGSAHATLHATTPGTDLAVGEYAIASSGDGSLSLSLTSAAASCVDTSGVIDVHQADHDGAGVLTAFAASYSMACGTGFDNVGEIRWSSTVPVVRYGTVNAGTATPDQTVTVAAGASAVTFGTATVTGPKGLAAPAFSITSDTCSSKTVPAGATCEIGVRGWAVQVGPNLGFLRIAGTNSAGDSSRVASLTIQGRETPAGAYAPVKPARILDTRSGTGAAKAKVGQGGAITVQVSGRGGIPSGGAAAVVLNLTATGSTTGGYLTAYPAGTARPTASSINFAANQTRANLVTVPLSSTGQLSIYNATGSTHVIGDVMGYYRTGATTGVAYGSYHPQNSPTRFYDSRSDAPLDSQDFASFEVTYGADRNPHVKAVAINLTATRATGTGFLTAFGGQSANDVPSTSTLNFTKGASVPNMAIVPVVQVWDNGQYYPTFSIANLSPARTDFIVDLVGMYDDNTLPYPARFKPLSTPKRIVDTRSMLGTTPLAAGATHTVVTPAAIGGWNTMALVANATGYKPTASTFLTLFRHGSDRPAASSLNPYVGTVAANMTMPTMGLSDDFDIYNSVGTANVIVDVAGTMEFYPSLPDGVTAPPPPGRRTSQSGAQTALSIAGSTMLRSTARHSVG